MLKHLSRFFRGGISRKGCLADGLVIESQIGDVETEGATRSTSLPAVGSMHPKRPQLTRMKSKNFRFAKIHSPVTGRMFVRMPMSLPPAPLVNEKQHAKRWHGTRPPLVIRRSFRGLLAIVPYRKTDMPNFSQ